MANDLRSYFTAKENQSQTAIPEFVTSLSGNVSQAELTVVSEELKKTSKPRKHYNKYFPKRIKTEVDQHALIYGTKSAMEHFGKKYPKYTFIRNSVNNWKK